MSDSMVYPARGAVAVTPDDTDKIGHASRGIYVGGAGDLKVDLIDGTTVTFVGLAAGVIHPICARRVYSTGTTATDIVSVY